LLINALINSKLNQTCSQSEESCTKRAQCKIVHKFDTNNCHKQNDTVNDTRCLAMFTFNLTHRTHNDAFTINNLISICFKFLPSRVKYLH